MRIRLPQVISKNRETYNSIYRENTERGGITADALYFYRSESTRSQRLVYENTYSDALTEHLLANHINN